MSRAMLRMLSSWAQRRISSPTSLSQSHQSRHCNEHHSLRHCEEGSARRGNLTTHNYTIMPSSWAQRRISSTTTLTKKIVAMVSVHPPLQRSLKICITPFLFAYSINLAPLNFCIECHRYRAKRSCDTEDITHRRWGKPKAYNKASLLKGRFGGIVCITGNSRLFKP